MILEIENLHWIDATSAEWLTACVEHLGGIPVLLVLTYRPGYRPPWIEQSYVTQLALPHLTAADSRRMLHALLQERMPGATVLEQLVVKAGGNPLFLEELAQGVQEQAEDAGSLDLPATINVVLNARLHRLTGEARTVLQHAAVIGETVPLPLLAAVMGDAAGDLQPVLGTLQAAEFLHVTHFGPEPVFRFKHVLTHEVVYRSVRDATRRRLHASVAEALETRFHASVAAQPEHLAAHYTAAGEVARALPYWLQAGQRAIARAANVEAIRHLTQGLTLLATLPETPTRLQQELTFSVTLGAPLIMTRGYAAPEVENAYSRARALSRQVGDTPQSFPALYGIALFYLVRGECQTAQQLMYQALRIAQQSQDPALLVLAHTLLGVTSFFCGEFVTTQEHLEQAIARYDPAQHHALAFRYGDDPGTLSLSYLHLVLCFQGYLDQARERSKQAGALARQLGHPFSLANPLITTAVLCQFCHEDMATYALAEEIITLSTQQGFAHWLGGGMIFQGWSLGIQGKTVEGMTQIHQGLKYWGDTGARLVLPYWLTLLAEAYGRAGQPGEGLDALAKALVMAEQDGESWWIAEIYRLKGELLLGQPHTTPARQDVEACFRQAIDIARTQHAKFLELRAATSLARLWQQQGKRQDAHELLTPLYNWFTEGFDTADLQAARALLDEIGG